MASGDTKNRAKPTGKRPDRAATRPRSARRLEIDIVSLDAEDIALARLQAHLRQVEDIRTDARGGEPSLSRTAIRLPVQMLQRLRERAGRERVTLSELIEAALARHLKGA
jgi:hypothetical protein